MARERGGIGRRARFRSWCPQGRGSSSLPARTQNTQLRSESDHSRPGVLATTARSRRHDQGAAASVTVAVFFDPSLVYASRTESPDFRVRVRAWSCSALVAGVPSISVMTSPGLRPAEAAGPPEITPTMNRPPTSCSLVPETAGATWSPRKLCVTVPVAMIRRDPSRRACATIGRRRRRRVVVGPCDETADQASTDQQHQQDDHGDDDRPARTPTGPVGTRQLIGHCVLQSVTPASGRARYPDRRIAVLSMLPQGSHWSMVASGAPRIRVDRWTACERPAVPVCGLWPFPHTIGPPRATIRRRHASSS
jgi:hypothetical protein